MALNSNALITLALAKSFLKIPTAETSQDAFIEHCINAFSDLFEGETDRKIKEVSVTEYHDGRKSNMITLGEYPVNEITSVKIDSTSRFSGSETTLDSSTYAIGDNNNALYYNTHFPSGFRNIKVVYKAGYTTIPSDIQNAALWGVFYYFNMRETKDIGRTSKGKGDESINILQELPLEVVNCINRHRRLEVPNTTRQASYE